MAINLFPKQLDKLWASVRSLIQGLHTHEAVIGVKQNTEAAVTADLAAAQDAEATFQAGCNTKRTLTAAVRAADDAGQTFIAKAKRILSNSLGTKWSVAWKPVGFVASSLATPDSVEERESLLESMKNYLTANPGKENAQEGVTAVEATARFTALKTARANLEGFDLTGAKNARNAAVDALRKRMRGLVVELGQLLPDHDTRYHSFGLNAPNDPETPEAPTDVVLAPGAPGYIVARWSKARRADRYKIFRKVVGTDNDFQYVDTVTGLEATLNTIPSGSTVEVELRAVNNAGESPFSEAHQIVVP